MNSFKPLIKTLLLIAIVQLVTCTSKSRTNLTCQSDTDCFQGEVCVNGLCATKCQTDTDCQSGYICSTGICVLQSDAGHPEDGGESDTGPDAGPDEGCSPPCEVYEWCNVDSCDLCNTNDHCGTSCQVCSGEMPVCGGFDQGCICNDSSCGDSHWCNAGSCAVCDVIDHCGVSCQACSVETPVCGGFDQRCICDENSCGTGRLCNSGSCEACNTDDHCGPNCSDCQGTTPKCDGNSGTCVCFDNTDCGPNEVCSSTTRACVPTGFYQWHTFHGSLGDGGFYHIDVDNNGNIYLAGNTLINWNGSNNQDPIHSYSGSLDIFILKLNGSGVYQWHTFFGSDVEDWGNGLRVDNNGNVYVTGYSKRAWNGSATGGTPQNSFSGNSDIFILKLNGSGDYQWHTFFGGNDQGMAIEIDDSRNIFVTGSSDAAWNGSNNHPPIHLHSGLGADIFILKLNGSGDYQWHTFFGGNSYDITNGIGVAQSGNVYATGTSGATWNGSDNGGNPLHDFTGGQDIFVLKLNGSGDYEWHTFYGSTVMDEGISLDTDIDENIYITGPSLAAWNGSLIGNEPLHSYSGDTDIFILKLNGSGGYLWHTFYGSNLSDFGNSITIGNQGDVYIAGTSQNDWNGPQDPLHPYSAGFELFVLKLDPDGAYHWHTFYGSGFTDAGTAIKADAYWNIYVTGWSDTTWDGPSSTSPINSHSGGDDIFVLKLYQ